MPFWLHWGSSGPGRQQLQLPSFLSRQLSPPTVPHMHGDDLNDLVAVHTVWTGTISSSSSLGTNLVPGAQPWEKKDGLG